MPRKALYLGMLAIIIYCALPLLLAQQASSGGVVPSLMKFTGTLSNADGSPLTGTVGVTFQLYKEQTGGAALWMETQNVVADKNGHYSAMLGSATANGVPADVFVAGEARWLSVLVSGQDEQPRTLLLSVPYALKALDAETIGGLPASAFVRANSDSSRASSGSAAGNNTAESSTAAGATGSVASRETRQANQAVKTPGGQVDYLPMFTSANIIADSNMFQNASGVNISGALNLMANKNSNGNVNAQGTVTAETVEANLSCCAGEAVTGVVGSGDALVGQSNSGVGVFGTAITGTAGLYGVLGSGDPVYSYGVYGENDNTTGGRGIYGYTKGASAIAIQGYAPGGNAAGVAGSSGTFGTQAHIWVGKTPLGVVGDSSSIGVLATSDPGIGLVAANDNSSYYVAYLENNGGGPVFDAQSLHGYVFEDAFGDLTASGAIVGAVKSFKIDHPLDPANKYLYHASIESSEMKNLYDGVALLDAAGSATISLPDWFEAVNGDFRYQLTAIGAPAPNLHVAQEVSNGQFTIAGGQPGMKVSWQVTGVRHDAYANAHPLQVTVDKPESERGYYIHPELYGASQEKSLASQKRAAVMQRTNQK
jgi:hypothetical protein